MNTKTATRVKTKLNVNQFGNQSSGPRPNIRISWRCTLNREKMKYISKDIYIYVVIRTKARLPYQQVMLGRQRISPSTHQTDESLLALSAEIGRPFRSRA